MRNRWCIFALFITSLLIPSAQALAHHGIAAYDMTQTTTLHGILTAFDWANPHSILSLEVTDEKGSTAKWAVTTVPGIMLGRCGWSSNGQRSGSFVTTGQHLTVIGNRVKTGDHILFLSKLILPDGKELGPSCSK